ncbi:hypothetical protein LRD18_04050 [Halorhodospira halochloris]|uniref:hypothetical protein n=1 Tax=Halorhodospira halochloris TaxID=1052 RepID=UPI001EE9434A|nr:hypothetical protein [Halorhodospira halochloris]MCG5530045.1 hypothetical protein [Halorhodospira halochloris]
MSVRRRIAITLLIFGLVLGPMAGVAGTVEAAGAATTAADSLSADAHDASPGDPCLSDHHDSDTPCFMGSSSCGGCIGATGTAPITTTLTDAENSWTADQLAAAHPFRDPKPPRAILD